jgi:hypothetical protein
LLLLALFSAMLVLLYKLLLLLNILSFNLINIINFNNTITITQLFYNYIYICFSICIFILNIFAFYNQNNTFTNIYLPSYKQVYFYISINKFIFDIFKGIYCNFILLLLLILKTIIVLREQEAKRIKLKCKLLIL